MRFYRPTRPGAGRSVVAPTTTCAGTPRFHSGVLGGHSLGVPRAQEPAFFTPKNRTVRGLRASGRGGVSVPVVQRRHIRSVCAMTAALVFSFCILSARSPLSLFQATPNRSACSIRAPGRSRSQYH